MELERQGDLLFTTVQVAYRGATIEIDPILIDTGSETTILGVDSLAAIHIKPSLDDELYTIRGVGGVEAVFARQLDFLQVGSCRLADFVIEVGGMDYGFAINGILGMDFLLHAAANINLRDLKLEFLTV